MIPRGIDYITSARDTVNLRAVAAFIGRPFDNGKDAELLIDGVRYVGEAESPPRKKRAINCRPFLLLQGGFGLFLGSDSACTSARLPIGPEDKKTLPTFLDHLGCS